MDKLFRSLINRSIFWIAEWVPFSKKKNKNQNHIPMITSKRLFLNQTYDFSLFSVVL